MVLYDMAVQQNIFCGVSDSYSKDCLQIAKGRNQE